LIRGTTLAEALRKEDRELRHFLAICPRILRDRAGLDGSLSVKDTLAHIAFWDDFTVRFFRRKLDAGSFPAPAPEDFEEQDARALFRMSRLPFGEVLARYLEATGSLLDFIVECWSELTEKDMHNFWIPLKHRRHHRLILERMLDAHEESVENPGLAAEA